VHVHRITPPKYYYNYNTPDHGQSQKTRQVQRQTYNTEIKQRIRHQNNKQVRRDKEQPDTTFNFSSFKSFHKILSFLSK